MDILVKMVIIVDLPAAISYGKISIAMFSRGLKKKIELTTFVYQRASSVIGGDRQSGAAIRFGTKLEKLL